MFQSQSLISNTGDKNIHHQNLVTTVRLQKKQPLMHRFLPCKLMTGSSSNSNKNVNKSLARGFTHHFGSHVFLFSRNRRRIMVCFQQNLGHSVSLFQKRTYERKGGEGTVCRSRGAMGEWGGGRRGLLGTGQQRQPWRERARERIHGASTNAWFQSGEAA